MDIDQKCRQVNYGEGECTRRATKEITFAIRDKGDWFTISCDEHAEPFYRTAPGCVAIKDIA